ncbi:AraC family transcriptional regulator [Paenibacillus donghaensis]|uniref:HTH araC/xylS-type domain-containing protein n=1 Tax=Paenibacillus donghaensis TaxID=414771 RepID=A0A2Z2K9T3_9BACL|nr:AraC family transcriptional regulator [Paenibacillus donghaensis]ASA23446.1 hypothetical protein B9T62_23140 [Paenibacillus donghaensis]
MKRINKLFESQFLLDPNLHMWVNRFTEDFTVPYHEHDFIEYCYVAEGNGFHHIEQEIFPIHKGQLFVVPIGVAHVFRPVTPARSSKPPVVYNCMIDLHLVAQLSRFQEQRIQEHLSSLGNKNTSYFSVIDRDGAIENLMVQLQREVSINDPGSITMLHSLLNQLIVIVYRRIHTDADAPATKTADFNHVIHFLEQNFNQAITLTELSRYSGWTTRHLQRLFLKHTGQSFHSLLQHLRIQKSCEMLRNSSLKIGLISELVGYRSIDSFNSVFKRNVGLTPSEYRKSSTS